MHGSVTQDRSWIDRGLKPVVVAFTLVATALLAALPNAPLLELAGSVASAQAKCDASTPPLVGNTQVAGLKVLGQSMPTDAIVQQAVTLYNGQTIDPASLDLSKVVLPAGLSF